MSAPVSAPTSSPSGAGAGRPSLLLSMERRRATDAETERDEALASLDRIQARLDRTSTELQNALGERDHARQRLAAAYAAYQAVTATNVADMQATIDEAEAEMQEIVADTNVELAERVGWMVEEMDERELFLLQPWGCLGWWDGGIADTLWGIDARTHVCKLRASERRERKTRAAGRRAPARPRARGGRGAVVKTAASERPRRAGARY
ncbi:hypothetical protein MMC27_005508 [Xylographa pallens]|nr:hypothetical protein [Xylographa pallens]